MIYPPDVDGIYVSVYISMCVFLHTHTHTHTHTLPPPPPPSHTHTHTPGGETFFNQIAHKMHVDPGDAILVWNVR